ncbi:MAG: ABC transporter ATP-binding protein/permease [Planctomycetota bacterium]|nr:ABC transporter ATP-binding protein [Planctomycetaceae bacterium]MDQ3333106.1 ABC transporter ATP-binding protein/permease [Planctomycetota bacterium]
MSTGSFASFRRVFSKRDLFRGSALWSVVCAVAASLFLCLLLFTGYLLAELLATGGRIVVDRSDAVVVDRLAALSGGRLAQPDEAAPTVTALKDADDTGIFPAVWWLRDTVFGPPLAKLWRTVPPLRTDWASLVTLAIAAVVFGLCRSFCLSRARLQADKAALDVVTRIRRSLHRQSLRLGPSDLLDQACDRVLELFTNEAERVREGIAAYVYRLGRHPFKLALLLMMALLFSWRDTLLCLVPLAACWIFAHRERKRRADAYRLDADRARSELQILGEALRKTRLVRGYGMEEFEQKQFETYLDRFQRNAGRAAGSERVMRAIGRGLLVSCVAVVAFLLGARVLNDPTNLSFAAALFLAAVFACMYRPAEMLWALRQEWAAAGTAAHVIQRYLDRVPEVGQAVGAKFLQPLSKVLRFDDVTYTIPGGRQLLDGLDLQIPAGELVAIVSSDPLEAKALVNLLPRFIEPQRGRVLYDGEDTAWATLESLRAETVVAAADPGLTGTVRENIACGRPNISLPQITEAAKAAHAHQFIQRLPQGYETLLGEHGEPLDAGQQFRLGLARAALVNPALLVVEEPTERLDEDTKNLLDDAYQRIFPGRTVIVLPTRLSSVKKADRVVVLHRGKVDAVGKHADLVRGCPIYRHWEYVNFNEFRGEV